MNKKYRIHLLPEERLELESLVAAGKAAITKRQRAQILLATDEDHPGGALPDRDAARAFDVSVSTVERTRRALTEHGLKIAVQGWPAHRKAPRGKVDGHMEAHLVAAACGPPPEGRSRWTLRLLGDKMVALGLLDSISPQTVGRTLKKRAQALADRTGVPAAGARRGFRPRHGGCARSVCGAPRSCKTIGPPG